MNFARAIFDRRFLVLAIACLCFVGCTKVDPLESRYGKRRGRVGAKSVNGTSAIARMFEQAGWDCASWNRLSPRLKEADVVFWAPDSHMPPSDEQIDWFEDWLEDGYERTLIFVGRDYDAEPFYWDKMQSQAAQADKEWYATRQTRAKYRWNSDRHSASKIHECRWFKFTARDPVQNVNKLVSTSQWGDDVESKDLELIVRSKLEIPAALRRTGRVEVLLETSTSELIAYRVPVGDGQVIVVSNGSFLLNLPLVNKQNRKLAGELISECSTDHVGRAMFVEETPLKLKIYDTEPSSDRNSFTLFTIWPMGLLLLQLSIIGVIACFVVFPIFGRARELRDTGVSDFGRHVEALGELIAATENRNYALQRLKHYEDHVRRDS